MAGSPIGATIPPCENSGGSTRLGAHLQGGDVTILIPRVQDPRQSYAPSAVSESITPPSKRRRQLGHLDQFKVKHWVSDQVTGKIVPDQRYKTPSKNVPTLSTLHMIAPRLQEMADTYDWPVTPASTSVTPKSISLDLNKGKYTTATSPLEITPSSKVVAALSDTTESATSQQPKARKCLFPAQDETNEAQYPAEWLFLNDCPPCEREKLFARDISASKEWYDDIWSIKGEKFFKLVCARGFARYLLDPHEEEWLLGKGHFSSEFRATIIKLDDIFLFQKCPRKLLIEYIIYELGHGSRTLCENTICSWKKKGSAVKSPPGRPALTTFKKSWMNFAYKLKPDDKGSLQLECGPQNIHAFRAHALRMQHYTSAERASRRHQLRIPIHAIEKADQFKFDFLEDDTDAERILIPSTFTPDMTPIWASECEDSRVIDHTFSIRTCYRMLEQNDVNFQSVTTVNKPMPSESTIQAWQKKSRAIMDDTEKYQSDRIILFMDETAVRHEANTRLPIPKGVKSVAGGAMNEKSGFSGVTLCSRDALSMSVLIILKCNVKNDQDLTTSRMLNTLHKVNFCAPDWQYGVYKCTVDQKQYIRPYLMNMEDGCLITVHNEGYMDSAVMQLWIEKLLVRISPGMRKLLCLDNFAAHLQKDVECCFARNNIDTIFLPANTTPILCIPDTHYHAPLKAFLARTRGVEIMEESLTWQHDRSQRLERGADYDDLPPFNPTNQTSASLLSSYMDFSIEYANSDDFRAGARRAWVKAGLLRSDLDGDYHDYTMQEKKINVKKHPTSWYDAKLQKKEYMTRAESHKGDYQVCTVVIEMLFINAELIPTHHNTGVKRLDPNRKKIKNLNYTPTYIAQSNEFESTHLLINELNR